MRLTPLRGISPPEVCLQANPSTQLRYHKFNHNIQQFLPTLLLQTQRLILLLATLLQFSLKYKDWSYQFALNSNHNTRISFEDPIIPTTFLQTQRLLPAVTLYSKRDLRDSSLIQNLVPVVLHQVQSVLSAVRTTHTRPGLTLESHLTNFTSRPRIETTCSSSLSSFAQDQNCTQETLPAALLQV